MKINFDEIFSSPLQRLKNSQVSKFSQYHTNNTLNNSFHTEAQVSKVFRRVHEQPQPSMMNAIHRHQREPGNYKWYKEFKFDPAAQTQRTQNAKPEKTVDVQEITERLYHPGKCQKKQCEKNFDTYLVKKLKEDNLPLNAPVRNAGRTLTETAERLKEPSALHEKLYREHLEKSFRAQELKEQYEESRFAVPPNYENKEYLTNYRNFYERLDEEVDRKAKKQIYYETHPNLILTNQNHQLFQPDLSSSKEGLRMLKVQPSIKPKLLKRQKNPTQASSTLDQLNASFESLNRSTEIIQRNEDQLVEKICTIFESDGMFRVRPESIGLLSDVEFEVIFPLIQRLEGKDIAIEEFEKKFKKYYKKLPTKDKQQIRGQNVRNKKSREAIKLQLSLSREKGKKMKSDRVGPKRTVDYLRKIEKFV